jgi:SAM-dependent methyltransferase
MGDGDIAAGSLRRGEYFALASGEDLERERILCLEAMADPLTISRLERIGVSPGWACLEVAAGGGSIAAWLGRRVAPAGRVLATDLNTRFLDHLQPPIEVQTLNLLADDIEEQSFDLVHGRAILMHLPEPLKVLAKMAAAVKPGGWLLIEEGDFEGFSAVEPRSPETMAWTQRQQHVFHTHTDAGVIDAFFGRRVRGLVEDLGFVGVVSEGVTHIHRGGEPGARFVELSSAVTHAAGAISDQEHSLTSRFMNDPTFVFTGAAMYGAWGRRPDQ